MQINVADARHQAPCHVTCAADNRRLSVRLVDVECARAAVVYAEVFANNVAARYRDRRAATRHDAHVLNRAVRAVGFDCAAFEIQRACARHVYAVNCVVRVRDVYRAAVNVDACRAACVYRLGNCCAGGCRGRDFNCRAFAAFLLADCQRAGRYRNGNGVRRTVATRQEELRRLARNADVTRRRVYQLICA